MAPNYRLLRGALCLCLPTAVVIALALRFALVETPRIVAGERDRVDAACEAEVRDLLENPGSADFVWRRGEGIVSGDRSRAEDFPADRPWKDWESRGRRKTKEMWGWLETPEGRLVWVRDTRPGQDSNVVYGLQTDLREFDYARCIYVAGGFSLFVLVGITFLGTRYFVESVKTRDDFMAAAAHDLTTPLVGLRFMIGRDDAEARTLNERLIRLVDNIKDFMRLGGRRREPRRETVDLLKAYEEAYSLFREDYRDLFGGRDVPVEMPRTDLPSLPVLGDETLLVQVLWNLLGNDLKYAAPYGDVKVVFRQEPGRVCADFVDEGQGMTSAQMRRAFDRYYRAKTVLQSGKGGFGIGLCTAREFARAMGGDLTVRANPPKGCVFTLELPAPPEKS